VKAYDEFLIAERKLYSEKKSLTISSNATIIFRTREYRNSMKNNYNKALSDYNIKENIAKELHYSRNKYNVDTPSNLNDLNMDEWKELKNSKSIYHSYET